MGKFRIHRKAWIASGGLDCVDHLAGTLERYFPVLCAVKSPYGKIAQGFRMKRFAAAANWNYRGITIGIAHGHRPHAKASHAQARQINASAIDSTVFDHLFDEAFEGKCIPMLTSRTLWGNDHERKIISLFD